MFNRVGNLIDEKSGNGQKKSHPVKDDHSLCPVIALIIYQPVSLFLFQ